MPCPITTHVLDTARGRPAAGMAIQLFIQQDGQWQPLAKGQTNSDGRITDWLDESQRRTGHYRVDFATGDWYSARGETCFYPQVQVEFNITAANEHHHIPLLISPFGFSTYRGS